MNSLDYRDPVHSYCRGLGQSSFDAGRRDKNKFKKPRTVVILSQVAEAITRQLDGRPKGWLFPSYRDEHISSRQVQNILDSIASRAGLQEVKRQDKAGKNAPSKGI